MDSNIFLEAAYYPTPKTPEVFDGIVLDVISRSIPIADIAPQDLHLVTRTARLYTLDFDDAYQYTVAERENLRIVSFDADFDRTPRGRRTPAQILAQQP